MANNQVPGAAPGTGAAAAANKDIIDDEERLEDGMEHLKELHLQIRQLRSAIPRMLSPLYAKHASPEAYFAAFNQSVANTQKEVQDFKQALTSEESTKIFKHAAASRRARPGGIKPWRYSDDPEWTTLKKRVKREEPSAK
ncbi:hypothetical protein V8F20_005877 [Naviculisporaceae sp. PSN 640]